jgi:iron complex outermembrane receptor protein
MADSRSFRQVSLAILAALSISAPALGDAPRRYDVPAGQLTVALKTLAEQSGVEFIYSTGLLKGLTTSGVHGELSAEGAVSKLLEGTNLELTVHESGALLIAPAAVPSAITTSLGSGGLRLARADTSQTAGAEKLDEVELEVTVLAKRNALERRAGGAKLPVSLLKLPQSVTIIDHELLEDQNVVKLEDALRNSAGVNAGGYFEGFDFYRIRGFDASGFTLLDGLLADQTFWTQEELYGMEQVEVLKGPMSGLYGQAPRQDSFFKIKTSAGSHDYFDIGLDGNMPLNDRMALRLNGVFRKQGSFVDNVKVGERYFAAPSFSWDIGDATKIVFLTQFIEENTGLAQPLPAEGTVLSNPNGKIPLTRAIGEPGFEDTADIGRQQYGWELVHSFSESLRFKQVARGSAINVNFQAIYPWYIEDDLRTLNRYVRGQAVRASSAAVDNQFILEAGERWRHTLLAGLDWYKFNQRQGFAYDFDYPAIDVIDPQYGLAPAPVAPTSLNPYQLKRTGLYFQDHVQLTERFSVLFGGRYDWTEETTDVGVEDKEFSPRAGATFEFMPGASVYVSYAAAFQPQGDMPPLAGSPPLAPEVGDQFELGLKTDLLDDRLTATVALYELTRENVAIEIATTPEYDFMATGEQRSRGVEIDSIIRFTPTWELIANATFVTAEITKDTVLQPGSRTLNVPDTFFNVWTKYTIPSGPLQGLGFSLGALRSGNQAGDDTYRDFPTLAFNLPAYTVVDAGISFERGRYRMSFDVDNLTDKVYFPSSYGRTFVMPGEPRTYRVGLEYDF